MNTFEEQWLLFDALHYITLMKLNLNIRKISDDFHIGFEGSWLTPYQDTEQTV